MFDHPYIPFLRRVEKPGRYVGGEFGAAVVPSDADLRIALSYPDAYEIGMSHIGLSVLYEIANSIEGISAERVFMPWPDMEAKLKEQGLPLVSLESARPLHNFDLLGFSLQYELTYTNLLAMLDLGRVPRRSRDRDEKDPLVIVGGPIAAQSEPLAPFVDLVLVGDGEEALPQLLSELVAAQKNGLSRIRTLEKLAEHPAVYAPGLLERVRDDKSGRLVVKDGDFAAKVAAVKTLGDSAPGYGPVPMVNAVFDRYSLEIARGCTEGCRFCQAGFMYRPLRERDEVEADVAVKRAVSCLGFDEVSLAALSSADHSRVEKIVSGLGERFTPQRVSLSVPSLRAYGLSEELVEIVSRLRATGVTLAPEAGSQRLRDVVNKNVTEEDLMAAAARFFDHRFTRIKLYFMLGLPEETDEDLAAIIDLSSRLRDMGRMRAGHRKIDVVVSVSTFVPKPFTPFEREKMLGPKEVSRRQKLLMEMGGDRRLDVRLHDPRLSWLEGIFSRGDASLADALERAVDLGARFDGWGEMFREDIWEKALADVRTDDLLLSIPDDGRLPWDHVETAVSAKFRLLERDRAKKATTTQPCGRYARGDELSPAFVCHACGAKCVAADLPVRPVRPKSEIVSQPGPRRQTGSPRPKPLPPPEGAVQEKIRVTLSIVGRQTFIGHLDTMRHFSRSLRRAGLDVVYTQGFHPKPKIESAPPLPLGTAGLAEPVDIGLWDPPSDAEIKARLNEALPPDLEARDVTRLKDGELKLAKSLSSAKYLMTVKSSLDEAKTAVEKVLAAEKIEITRTRKKRTKVVDVRPYVLDVKIIDGVPEGLQIPVSDRSVVIHVHLDAPASGGTKPSEVFFPFLGDAAEEAWVIRTAWEFRKETCST